MKPAEQANGRAALEANPNVPAFAAFLRGAS